MIFGQIFMSLKIRKILLVTACKQYCHAAGATQGNIAYKQNVGGNANKTLLNNNNHAF